MTCDQGVVARQGEHLPDTNGKASNDSLVKEPEVAASQGEAKQDEQAPETTSRSDLPVHHIRNETTGKETGDPSDERKDWVVGGGPLCRFFSGKYGSIPCKYGDKCYYSHDPSKASSEAKVLCHDYFVMGKCSLGEICPNSHDPYHRDSSQTAEDDGKQPCTYFMQGNCMFGDQCYGSHDLERCLFLKRNATEVKTEDEDSPHAKVRRLVPKHHRLHYRWAQLEADRCGLNIGSPLRPIPRASRVMELDDTPMTDWPSAPSEKPLEQARFSNCAGVYPTIDYNTFCKNGCLKLTEVELYFMSSMMSKKTCGEWVVVYLGIGSGERFKYLRDEFFPDLAVIAFDPLDNFFTGEFRTEVEDNARKWTEDGTNFTFVIGCYDGEKHPPWILDKVKSLGRKLLLISDIRGVAFKADGVSFDKDYDQELQWSAIKSLRPVKSLLKFTFPDTSQFFDYAPGVVLKQIFTNYLSREVRLLVDGVPETTRRYNAWNLYEQMMFHHEYMRGQVYENKRKPGATLTLCSCYDCTLLYDTVLAYAEQNDVDANEMVMKVITYQVYTPASDAWRRDDPIRGGNGTNMFWYSGSKRSIRWRDIEYMLQAGTLNSTVAALELPDTEEEKGYDWSEIVDGITKEQPEMAQRLRNSLPKPATRLDLARMLGSMSDPFTVVRSDLNFLRIFKEDWNGKSTWDESKNESAKTD